MPDIEMAEANTEIKHCSDTTCCKEIKRPGDPVPKKFLTAAEEDLRDQIGVYFELEKPCLYPPYINTIGEQEEKGFSAEYRVFNSLKESNIPVHIFYSWKPHGSNDELSDFVLVAKNVVIVLEVKAFSLNGPENVPKIVEKYEKIHTKSRHQLGKAKELIKTFLEKHGCSYPLPSMLPVETYSVFPNFEKSTFEQYISDNMDRINVLCEENLISELERITQQTRHEENSIAIRTLLFWFYGNHAYLHLSNGEKVDESQSVTRTLNEVHKESKMHYDGVFLSNQQLAVVNCCKNFLNIVGLPGTGKTFCLVAKIANCYRMIDKSGKMSKRELIVVMHESEKTREHIQRLVFAVVEDQSGQYIMFIDPWNRNVLIELLNLERNTTFKIFWDDHHAQEHDRYQDFSQHRELLSRSNFVCTTSYRVSSPDAREGRGQYPYRPISQVQLTSTLEIEETTEYAVLTPVLRNSCQIATLARILHQSYIPKKDLDVEHLGFTVSRILHDKLVEYEIGHRVIGPPVEFIASANLVFRDTVIKKTIVILCGTNVKPKI